jgi:uracil-DNA glycosylase
LKVSNKVNCSDFPCINIDKKAHVIPGVEIDPEKIKAIIISEATPTSINDYYYSDGNPLFEKTTVQAFQDAGLNVKKLGELLDLGFYFTTAVKCGKTGYAIKAETIKNCSFLLEEELDIFPNLRVVMLMGDIAIKAFNEIAKRRSGKRVIPAGSTYKIRDTPYYYGNVRVFPSYLQAGPSFFIEKSKRRMIAEDIHNALNILEL